MVFYIIIFIATGPPWERRRPRRLPSGAGVFAGSRHIGLQRSVTFLLLADLVERASNQTYGDFHDDLPMMVTHMYTSHIYPV